MFAHAKELSMIYSSKIAIEKFLDMFLQASRLVENRMNNKAQCLSCPIIYI